MSKTPAFTQLMYVIVYVHWSNLSYIYMQLQTHRRILTQYIWYIALLQKQTINALLLSQRGRSERREKIRWENLEHSLICRHYVGSAPWGVSLSLILIHFGSSGKKTKTEQSSFSCTHFSMTFHCQEWDLLRTFTSIKLCWAGKAYVILICCTSVA